MDIGSQFLTGLAVALQADNLMYCALGVIAGTLVGVLPGIGPTAAIGLLLPATYQLSPTSAIIMLAGISYGAMYGGSITSILVKIPGEAASVITCMDGYQMTRNGRAGPALGIAAFGSFIAGTIAVLGVMLLAPTLARVALKFGAAEYFSLMLMSLMIVTYLVRGSMINALIMGALGLFLGSIGMDPINGRERFTYGFLPLSDGIGIVPVVIGLFGVAEVLENIGTRTDLQVFKVKVRGLLPSRRDWKDSAFPIARGTTLGFFAGIFPGISPMIPTFLSYAIEKRLSRHPEKFGTGAIEGVAAPEACNNATATSNFIPLLSLGIPSNAFNAVLLGALMIYGLQPGPALITTNPDFFWGVIASMYIGNVMLLILNVPLIPMWVWLLRIPYHVLAILILVFCFVGAYSVSNSIYDVVITFVFGFVGIVIKRFGFESAPLILAFVLAPMLEISFRQSMLFSDGSFSIFVTQPIALTFIVLSVLVLIAGLVRPKPVFVRESGSED